MYRLSNSDFFIGVKKSSLKKKKMLINFLYNGQPSLLRYHKTCNNDERAAVLSGGVVFTTNVNMEKETLFHLFLQFFSGSTQTYIISTFIERGSLYLKYKRTSLG